MTANTEPIFKGEPFHWRKELTSQIMPRIGGSVGATSPLLLGIAGDYGAIIEDAWVEVTGNVSANVAFLFTLQTGETSVIKVAEVGLTAVAGSNLTTAIAGYPIRFVLPNLLFEYSTAKALFLTPNESLYCALGTAEATSRFIIHVQGGDYDVPE